MTKFYRLYEKEFSADTQWEDLTPDFDGLSSVFLRKLLNNLFQYAQIKIKSSEDKGIVLQNYKKKLLHVC